MARTYPYLKNPAPLWRSLQQLERRKPQVGDRVLLRNDAVAEVKLYISEYKMYRLVSYAGLFSARDLVVLHDDEP
jgi:hypothetical protein